MAAAPVAEEKKAAEAAVAPAGKAAPSPAASEKHLDVADATLGLGKSIDSSLDDYINRMQSYADSANHNKSQFDDITKEKFWMTQIAGSLKLPVDIVKTTVSLVKGINSSLNGTDDLKFTSNGPSSIKATFKIGNKEIPICAFFVPYSDNSNSLRDQLFGTETKKLHLVIPLPPFDLIRAEARKHAEEHGKSQAEITKAGDDAVKKAAKATAAIIAQSASTQKVFYSGIGEYFGLMKPTLTIGSNIKKEDIKEINDALAALNCDKIDFDNRIVTETNPIINTSVDAFLGTPQPSPKPPGTKPGTTPTPGQSAPKTPGQSAPKTPDAASAPPPPARLVPPPGAAAPVVGPPPSAPPMPVVEPSPSVAAAASAPPAPGSP